MSKSIPTTNISFSGLRTANNNSCNLDVNATNIKFSDFSNKELVSSNTTFVDKNPSGPPDAREGHSGALTDDNRLIICGGRGSSGLLNDTWSYDTSNNSWTELHNGSGTAPSARQHHKCVYFDNTMYLFGGTIDNNSDTSDQLWKLDLSSTPYTWSAITPTGSKPTKRAQHILEIEGNQIYLFGGNSSGTTYDELWRFNTSSLEWDQLKTPTGKKRYGHSSLLTADNIYIFGGYDGSNYLNDIMKYNITLDTWDTSFYSGGTPGTSVPPKLQYSSFDVLTDHCFFIFGGYDGVNSVSTNDIWEFNTQTKTWKKIFTGTNTNPPNRYNHVMAIDVVDHQAKMVVFGGTGTIISYLNKTYSYTLADVFGSSNPLKISDLKGKEFY